MSDLIAQLRRKLVAAEVEREGSSFKFLVDEAEIEMQVVATQEEGAGVGVKFWVLNTDMKDKVSDAVPQRVKLKLKPTDAVRNRKQIRGFECDGLVYGKQR